MTDMETRRRAEEVADLAREVLGHLPHVRVLHGEGRRTMQRATRAGTGTRAGCWRQLPGVALTVEGWSPSLHAATCVVDVMDLDDARPTLEAFADAQQARMRKARVMGRDRPFSLRTPHGPDGAVTDVGHMTCDRSALRMMIESADDDVGQVAVWLRQDVEEHHQGVRSGNRVRGTTIHVRGIAQDHEVVSGYLMLRSMLPASVLARAAGRFVGDLVHAHPDIARRRIVAADPAGPDGTWTAIRMNPDNVRVGNVLLI